MAVSLRFHSILFERSAAAGGADLAREPDYFSDLNLDQVRAALTAGREEYDLEPFFHAPLHDPAEVEYRHEILRDLDEPPLRASVERFAQRMRTVRERVEHAEKLHYRYQRERWFLDAVEMYADAVASLSEELTVLDLRSRGFQAFREYLAAYGACEQFVTLTAELRAVRDGLAAVAYSVHINGGHVKVSRYEGEPDYSAEVEETFARFKQGAVKDYRIEFSASPFMDQVETRVLGLVARLYPEAFEALDAYCAGHRDFVDEAIRRFDREVQFYLAYLEYVDRLRSAGLPFCYPAVSGSSKEIHADETFDLALAAKLGAEGGAVVGNSFCLRDPERIVVVTGPNQGGKTTFARMFGQLHHLAALGFPVPGADAALFLPDRIFGHFDREEDPATMRGKLEEELVRIRGVLEEATGDSLIIMNESFASTSLRDARFLNEEVLGRVIALGALCVCVTFIDELASLGPATVSMVATVAVDDPVVRTYKLERRPADGLAYATAIAERYGLTYDALRTRIAR